jgi:membrane protease subunit HflK
MRRTFLVLSVLVLVLVAYALTGVTQVRPGERAVVRRFGRVLPYKPQPGLLIGLPWGMDRVERIPVDRVQSVVVGYKEEDASGTSEMPAGQLLTGDHNLVNVQVTLYYKVRPDEIEKYLIQADRVDAVLSRAVESAMAEWVAARTVDDVLLHAKTQLGPELVERTRQRVERTQERPEAYDLGVQVLDARVGFITPPGEVKEAFDNVARAQATIRTMVNKAEQQASSNKSTADAGKYRLEQETAAYVSRQQQFARSDAERFLTRLHEYEAAREKNPEYLRQIWEEERGKLLATLKANGQIGLLDHHLGPDGLDITVAPPLPKKP